MKRAVKPNHPSGSPDAESAYSAPALEKGLDILELLAAEAEGLTQNQIAQRLDRSVGELYRMLVALERRGYVGRRDADGTYRLTLRLFELAHIHPPVKRLLSEALAEMHALAERTGQSCHLALHEGGRILVVAQAESPRPRGFAVRLGAAFPLAETASGRVLCAFQAPGERDRCVTAMLGADRSPRLRARLEARLDAIVDRGYEEARSDTVPGITDISAPILNHLGAAVAAVTVPFVAMSGNPSSLEQCADAVQAAARQISRRLGHGALGS